MLSHDNSVFLAKFVDSLSPEIQRCTCALGWCNFISIHMKFIRSIMKVVHTQRDSLPQSENIYILCVDSVSTFRYSECHPIYWSELYILSKTFDTKHVLEPPSSDNGLPVKTDPLYLLYLVDGSSKSPILWLWVHWLWQFSDLDIWRL